MEMSCVCIIQHSSYQPHVAAWPLKSGLCDWGADLRYKVDTPSIDHLYTEGDSHQSQPREVLLEFQVSARFQRNHVFYRPDRWLSKADICGSLLNFHTYFFHVAKGESPSTFLIGFLKDANEAKAKKPLWNKILFRHGLMLENTTVTLISGCVLDICEMPIKYRFQAPGQS